MENMGWQILLGINLVSSSIREFLNKKIVHAMHPLAGYIYMLFFGQIWLYLLQIFWYKGSLFYFHPLLAITGILLVIGFLGYFYALQISLSQSILFQSYSILVTIVLSAVFLGEGRYFDIATSSGIKIISGIFLAFVSLWYLLHVKSKKEQKKEKKWFLYILITIVFIGTGSFLTIFSIRTASILDVLINQNNAALVFLFVLLPFFRIKLPLKQNVLTYTFLNSIFGTVAVLAFYGAVLVAPVAKIYPIQQISLVIITICTGLIFFRETHLFTRERFFGFVLGVVGIAVLATS